MDWEDYHRMAKSSSADNRARRGCRGGSGPSRGGDSDYTGWGQGSHAHLGQGKKPKPPTCLHCSRRWGGAAWRRGECPTCVHFKAEPVNNKSNRQYFVWDS